MTQKYLTVAELADRFRVSPETVRAWLKYDQGPRSVKIVGRRLFPTAEVEKYEADPEGYQRKRDLEVA